MKHLTCSLCEALCGLSIDLDEHGAVKAIRGDDLDPLSKGHICPKALGLQDLHDDPDRLRHPVRRTPTGWEAISWEEALDETATRFVEAQRDHGPDALGLYLGNPMAHNYSGVLALQALKEAMGSRHTSSATSADQLPHMFASLLMFGHQLALPVPDIDRTDLFVIMGANPLASNGSLMTAPGVKGRLKAIQARGGEVVVIDPRRTETAMLADTHHFVRPGTDALLLLAMLHTLSQEGLIRAGRWRAFSKGLGALRGAALGFSPEAVADTVGIDPDQIRALARKLAHTPRAVLYGRFGVCTQRFGGLCAWLINAINAVTGHLDEPGGLMFTQPALDLAALASLLGQRGSHNQWQSRVSGLPEFGGDLPVSALAEEMLSPGEGQIRALITVAGNPVLSVPNGTRMDEALAGLDFMVSLDFYINETTRHAHIILPPISPLERDHFGLVFHALAVRNTVKYSPPLFPEVTDDTRPDWTIVLELTRRMLKKRGGVAGHLGAAFVQLLAKAGPRRWLDWGLRAGPHEVALDTLEAEPHGIDLGPLEPVMPERLRTEDGLLDLAPHEVLGDLVRLEEVWQSGVLGGSDGLTLIGRRHLRSLNSWMHNSHRLVRGKPRCTLLMHPDDARARHLEDGQQVAVETRTGRLAVTLSVDDAMMPGVVSLPHGWGHDREGVSLQVASKHAGVSLNDLTDETHIDRLTGNAGFSGVPVEVSPHSETPTSSTS